MRRINRADQRLFDAYGRGGSLVGHELVLPVDFLLRPAIRNMLTDWLTGTARFDLELLQDEWKRASDGDEPAVFLENVIHLLAILGNDRTYAPGWPGVLHILGRRRLRPRRGHIVLRRRRPSVAGRWK